MHFSPQTDASLSVHFESWHAVYLDYIPDTTKGSPVLPWFFLLAEISGIRNRFSTPHFLLAALENPGNRPEQSSAVSPFLNTFPEQEKENNL